MTEPVGRKLRTYTGRVVNMLGAAQVVVGLNGVEKNLKILVSNDKGPSLLGRDWIKEHPAVVKHVNYLLSARLQRVN